MRFPQPRQRRSPINAAAREAVPNPNRTISGTGSAYDGGAYKPARPAVPTPNVSVLDAYSGSAYVEYLLSGPSTDGGS